MSGERWSGRSGRSSCRSEKAKNPREPCVLLDQFQAGVYATPLSPGRKLAQIAVDDIAECAIVALEDPARFAGTRFDLAGDDVSGDDAVAILTRVSGRPFSYFQVPMEMIRQGMGDDGVLMYEWFERTGYDVDRAKLASAFPGVAWTSFEEWARRQPVLAA